MLSCPRIISILPLSFDQIFAPLELVRCPFVVRVQCQKEQRCQLAPNIFEMTLIVRCISCGTIFLLVIASLVTIMLSNIVGDCIIQQGERGSRTSIVVVLSLLTMQVARSFSTTNLLSVLLIQSLENVWWNISQINMAFGSNGIMLTMVLLQAMNFKLIVMPSHNVFHLAHHMHIIKMELLNVILALSLALHVPCFYIVLCFGLVPIVWIYGPWPWIMLFGSGIICLWMMAYLLKRNSLVKSFQIMIIFGVPMSLVVLVMY
mmetsp:Transcript_2527/g.4732  ORF Transcript_2527/g.4732 Transcript_2527/m.4732 type:complete len:261 (+) Transcript_2527:1199-1981(+)